MTHFSSLTQLIAKRRMCRSYKSDAVPVEVLDRVLDKARRSPSAGHSQAIRFGVVSSQACRLKIANALGEERYRERGFPAWLSRAPVHLLVGVCSDSYQARYSELDKRTKPEEWPLAYEELDAGKSLMLLYLAAVDENLACGYLGPHRAEPALKVVSWPSDWRFLGLVTIGYPDWSRQRASHSHQRGWRPLHLVIRRLG